MGCGGSSAPQVSPASHKKPKDPTIEDNEAQKQPDQIQNEEELNYIKRMEEINNLLHESVDFIIKCIAKIPKPEKVRPLVCLNEYAAPLAVSVISLTTGNSTEIYLPVAALSVYNKKHIAILGQIDILSSFDSSNPDACAFLENSIRWTGGFGRNKYIVLLLGLDPNEANHMSKVIQSFDFTAVILDKLPKDEDEKPLPYHTIITTTQNSNIDRLRKFRGGLIIGVKNPSASQVNSPNVNQKPKKPQSQSIFNTSMVKFMLECGIGFPNFSLEVGSASSDFIKTNRPFRELKEVTFLNLIKSYQEMTTENDEIIFSKYDNLVTSLRYHVIALPRKGNIHLLKLGKFAYEFLVNTNYEIKQEGMTASDSARIINNDDANDNTESNDIGTENSCDPFHCSTANTTSYTTQNLSLICPSIIQCITVVLLTEILHRLPPKDFQNSHFGKRFPGEVDEDQARKNVADFRTHHQLLCESWSSTGLYLPSGILAQAVISKCAAISLNNMVKLSIQVGCHTVCTLSNKGPWKRWPIITDSFKFPNKREIVSYQREKESAANSNSDENDLDELYSIDEDEITLNICSPFGGIVYVVVEEFLLDKPFEIEIVFRNFIQYPVFSSSEPSIYNDFMASINQFNITTGKINYNGSISEVLANIKECDSTSNISSNYQANRSSHAQLPFALSKNNSTTTSYVEKPILCPWMEIESQFIEISIPTNRVDIFGDLSKYCEFIDDFLSELLQFTLDESQRTYRLVFDIELPDDKPVCDYPISMPMRMISNLSQIKPSSELLYLLFYVGTLSLYQINFGKIEAESIAMVAAFHAFTECFKQKNLIDINPMDYLIDSPPPLFNELWLIYTQNESECFIRSLSDMREKFEMRPIYNEKKVWELFVSKISQYTGKHYDKRLIEKKEEHIGDGMLLSSSSRSLLQFQLTDAFDKEKLNSFLLPTLDK